MVNRNAFENYNKDNSIMLDISTMLCFASDVINDPKLIERFPDITYKYESNRKIRQEIIDELENPLMPKLEKITRDKYLLACKTAIEKSDSIVNTFGSDLERVKYDELKKKMVIIDDNPCEEYRELLSEYPIYFVNIFGTSKKMDIPLLTGYIEGIKISIREGLEIDYIAHRSRNIVGDRPTGDENVFL